jgi:hypothetical protein
MRSVTKTNWLNLFSFEKGYSCQGNILFYVRQGFYLILKKGKCNKCHTQVIHEEYTSSTWISLGLCVGLVSGLCVFEMN